MEKKKLFDFPQVQWHFAHSFLGVMIGSLTLFVLYVIAGKVLGPTEFGKASIILVIAQVANIWMLFSLDTSSLRLVSGAKNQKEQADHIVTITLIALAVILLVASLVFQIRRILMGMLSLDEQLFAYTLIYAVIVALRLLLDSFLRALGKFKLQAKIKIIEALVALTLFGGLLYWTQAAKFEFLILAIAAAHVLSIFLALPLVYPFWRSGKFSWQVVKKVLSFNSKMLAYMSFSGVIFMGDKLVVNKYLGSHALGIFSVHYTLSLTIVGVLVSVANNVSLPLIAKSKQKSLIYAKLNKLINFSLLPLLFSLLGSLFLGLKLYGSQYPSNLWLQFLFAVYGCFYFMAFVYEPVVLMHSLTSLNLALALLILRSALLILAILLVAHWQLFSLEMVVILFSVNFGLDFLGQWYLVKKYVLK